jgi:hypothetical protein
MLLNRRLIIIIIIIREKYKKIPKLPVIYNIAHNVQKVIK